MLFRSIEHDPSYAGGYYALGLTIELRAAGTADHRRAFAAALEQFAQAAQRWSKADLDMPELRVLRQELITPQK